MTTTMKTTGAALIAAVLTGLLFLSPVGISNAQDDTSTEEVPAEHTDRPERESLTDEEREALQAEHQADQAERQAAQQARLDAFAGELGVTGDDVVAAARTVLADELDAKVAAGDITQERADEILTRFDENDGLPLLGLGGGRGGPGHGHDHGGGRR